MLRAAIGIVFAAAVFAQSSPDELIAAGHWKRARTVIEERYRADASDPLTCFLLSQIRNAFEIGRAHV